MFIGWVGGVLTVLAALAIWQKIPELIPAGDSDDGREYDELDEIVYRGRPMYDESIATDSRWRGDCTGFGAGSTLGEVFQP